MNGKRYGQVTEYGNVCFWHHYLGIFVLFFLLCLISFPFSQFTLTQTVSFIVMIKQVLSVQLSFLPWDVKTDSLAPLLLFIGESLPLPTLKIRKSHTCQREKKKNRKTEKRTGAGLYEPQNGPQEAVLKKKNGNCHSPGQSY